MGGRLDPLHTASMLRTKEQIIGLAPADAVRRAGHTDERTFKEAIWQSVKGAGSAMPAPRHLRGGPADD